VLISAAALVVALVALRHADSRPSSSYAEVAAASIERLHGLMSQDEVRSLLGPPASVYRNNARAQCWAYHTPYEVQMCFGPKRRLAWWASNAPRQQHQHA
jgi:hypothetical protein